MTVRNTTIDDLLEIEAIYARARQFMRETGNPDQWKDSHPARELILHDFEAQTGFCLVDERGKIRGVFAFILGEDPTYARIDGAGWLNDKPYGTIHRVASDGTRKGILEEVLEFCKSKTGNIRIDTYKDNIVMQNALTKAGFTRCGIIYLANGDPRIAFQLEVKQGGFEAQSLK